MKWWITSKSDFENERVMVDFYETFCFLLEDILFIFKIFFGVK